MKLCLSDVYFEYDIRGLMVSFYPWEIFSTEPVTDSDDFLRIIYQKEPGENVRAEIELHDGSFQRKETAIFCLTDKTRAKHDFMKVVYRMLCEAKSHGLPWGTLSGIRPTKIPMKLLREGKTEAEIAAYMREELCCSDEKTALAIDIAKHENRILTKIDPENGYSLYIHIPFCPTTCLYCSFTSYPVERFRKILPQYLAAIEKELISIRELFRGKKLQSVYFGGGTPTAVSETELSELCHLVVKHFDLSDLLEWTVEAGRPDSLTREKLLTLKKFPVTRISVNPQTMNQKTLDLIGRRHTVEDIREKYALARELGFDNINMDLILGLPGEDIEDIRHTIREVTALRPDSITVHSLALKRASRLNLQKEQYRESALPDPENAMKIVSEAVGRIQEKPYYLYRQKNMTGNLENTGYALPGKEGIYNILIMEEVQSIAACGAGAVSKRVDPDGLIRRCENVKDISLYLSEIDEMIERKKALYE